MADEEENNDGNTEEAGGGGGGKKKVLILAVLGLILIGASVGGTITVLSMMNPEPEVVAEGEEALEEAPVKKPAIYYPLKPPYIVNIDAKGRRRYLQAEITLLIRDNDVIAAIELHRPSVDHTVNMIVGGQIFEDIQTAEGKEFLRIQILQELQALFEKEIGKPGIEQVLFTNFVMQ